MMGRWLKRARAIPAWIRGSRALRNILVIMTGTAVAQGLGFALAPVISRLFAPADFGVFGAFSAVSGVMAAGVTLEYTQAILLPKANEDAINLFAVSCVSTLVVAVLCLGCGALFPSVWRGGLPGGGGWMLPMLGVAAVAGGINRACQAWCVRVKAFRHTSASQIVRSLSSNGAQIGCGYFHGGAPGLVVGSVLGDVLASVNLALVLRPDVRRLRQAVGWGRMRQLALEYRDFPKFAASQNVINTLSMGLPVLLLTHFYGLAVAGAYAFAWRILGASMGLVLTALRQVLFQKACETQHHGGGLAALYVRITAGLFAMALLPALALIAWGPRIFTWTFGAPWLEAGIFARALVVWLGFAFCNLPAILFAKLIRFQRAVFLADMAMLVARALALLFGGMCLGATATIWLFCVLSAVMNLVLILLVGYAVMKREGDVGLERIRESLGGGQSRPP